MKTNRQQTYYRVVTLPIDDEQADGQITIVQGRPTLEYLYGAIGGRVDTVEVVPYFDSYEGRRCTAWADENGLITGAKPNTIATKMWHTRLRAKKVMNSHFEYKLVGRIVLVMVALEHEIPTVRKPPIPAEVV